MRCPSCGLELRVKERTEEGKILLVCRNPKCGESRGDKVVKVIE